MYELIRVSNNCFYIESPAKIGLIKLNETDVCLIDSGNDKNAGKKIKKILDENHWNLTAIYNTHSNADHIGGNKYLQEYTGCKIFAPQIECEFTNNPILEPAFLYGAFPPKELLNKFLFPQKSNTEILNPSTLPEGLKIIPLPGHFFNMVGYSTAEGIVYLADCLASKETLDKYKLVFIYDVEKYLETLEKIKNIEGKLFIPSHAEPMEDITELAQYNIDNVYEVAEKIISLCIEPVTFEKILHDLFKYYNMTMNFNQYALVGSTIRSYLTWLKNNGKLTVEFLDHYLLWKKIQ